MVECLLYICNIGPCCRIQLPDLRYIDCTVDFSVKTFNASVGMCKDLALRHPEELSLCKPLDPEHLRQNYQVILISRHRSAEILGRINNRISMGLSAFFREILIYFRSCPMRIAIPSSLPNLKS